MINARHHFNVTAVLDERAQQPVMLGHNCQTSTFFQISGSERTTSIHDRATLLAQNSTTWHFTRLFRSDSKLKSMTITHLYVRN